MTPLRVRLGYPGRSRDSESVPADAFFREEVPPAPILSRLWIARTPRPAHQLSASCVAASDHSPVVATTTALSKPVELRRPAPTPWPFAESLAVFREGPRAWRRILADSKAIPRLGCRSGAQVRWNAPQQRPCYDSGHGGINCALPGRPSLGFDVPDEDGAARRLHGLPELREGARDRLAVRRPDHGPELVAGEADRDPVPRTRRRRSSSAERRATPPRRWCRPRSRLA